VTSLYQKQKTVLTDAFAVMGVSRDQVLRGLAGKSGKGGPPQRSGAHSKESDGNKGGKDQKVANKEVCAICGNHWHVKGTCHLTDHPDRNKNPDKPWHASDAAKKWKERPIHPQDHCAANFLLNGEVWEGAPKKKSAKPFEKKCKDSLCIHSVCNVNECMTCDWGEESEVHQLCSVQPNIKETNHLYGFITCSREEVAVKVNYLMDSGAIVGNYVSEEMYEWLKKVGETVHVSNVRVKGVFGGESKPSRGKVKVQISIPYEKVSDRNVIEFLNIKRKYLFKNQYLTFSFTAEIIPMKYDVILGAPIMDQLRKLRNSRYDEILDRKPIVREKGFGRQSRTQASYESDALQQMFVAQQQERTLERVGEGKEVDRSVGGVQRLRDLIGGVQEVDDVTDFPDEPILQSLNAVTESEEEFMHYINVVEEDLEKETNTVPARIEGSPEFVSQVQELCRMSGVFSPKLAKVPAFVTPYAMEIDKEEWEQSKNRGKPRTLGRKKDQVMKKFIDKLLDAGVIEESTEAVYHSFAHLVLKGHPTVQELEGKPIDELVEYYRMVIDSRALNKATKRTLEFPMPTVKTLMGNISEERNECFSKFDLTKGYWQVELHRDSRLYTAFMTSEGVYQWVRLPMGLRGAPSHFQHLMRTQVLKGVWKSGLHAYMDDILLGTRSEAEMILRLKELFVTLKKFNVTLNPAKTQIGLKEVEFIGHTITKDGISFSREKIAEVIAVNRPEFDVQLKSFVGLVNYFASHIPNFSTLMGPLNRHLHGYVRRRPKKVEWTEESTAAFEELRKRVNEIPVLFFPSEEGEVIVETDASDYGIGGWCYQLVKKRDSKGVMREVKQPIAFVSQALAPGQYKWDTHMKEAYAINIVLQKLDYLLGGVKFRLRTDHKNLTFIKEAKNDMVQRWKMRIQSYDCDVEHVPGEENDVADDLSRMVRVEVESEQVIHLIDNYVIPEDVHGLLEKCHNDEMGHLGVQRTYLKVLQLMQETGIKGANVRNHVRRFVQRCPVCQRNQLNRILVKSAHFTVEAYEPWERSAWDLITGLPDDGYGHTKLLVGIDCLTRFVVLYPLRDGSANEVARKMLLNASVFGATCQILVDNGSEFANQTVQELNMILGSEIVHTVPYSHQQNAIVERVNKEIMGWVRDRFVNTDEVTKWGDWYPLISRALNGSVGFARGISPAGMLYGNMVDMDRVLLRNPATTGEEVRVSDYMKNLLSIQEKILQAVQLRQEDKIKHRNLENNTDAVDTGSTSQRARKRKKVEMPGGRQIAVEVGDYVLIGYDPSTKVQAKSKWRANLRGPFEVLKVKDSKVTVTDGRREFSVPTQWCSHYLFTPEMEPVIECLRGTRYQVIDRVISSRGEKDGPRKDLQFLVRWVGMTEEDDTWCNYDEISWSHKFHDYCNGNKLKKLIPQRFKSGTHYSTARVAVRDTSRGPEEVEEERGRGEAIEHFFTDLTSGPEESMDTALPWGNEESVAMPSAVIDTRSSPEQMEVPLGGCGDSEPSRVSRKRGRTDQKGATQLPAGLTRGQGMATRGRGDKRVTRSMAAKRKKAI